MDNNRSHYPLNLRDLLRGFPTIRHPLQPWRESKGIAIVRDARQGWSSVKYWTRTRCSLLVIQRIMTYLLLAYI